MVGGYVCCSFLSLNSVTELLLKGLFYTMQKWIILAKSILWCASGVWKLRDWFYLFEFTLCILIYFSIWSDTMKLEWILVLMTGANSVAFHPGIQCLPKYSFRGFQYTKGLKLL